jgi:hypothetical protein
MEKYFEMREDLFHAMKQLRTSIDDALLNMTKMYGEEHYAIQRLKSYYPALDKQLDYAHQLHSLLLEKQYDEYMLLISKIQAISDMIKIDAKSLLNSLTTGKDLLPEQNGIN